MSNCNSNCPKWFVGNDVREIMQQNSALTEFIGEDIYPVIAPEGTKGPFILYQRDKYKKSYTKMGVYEEECHLLITIVADDYDTAIYLAFLVDNALQGSHTNPETGCNLKMELYDSTEGFEDNKYFESLTYSIK
jgi:hypothetical protein